MSPPPLEIEMKCHINTENSDRIKKFLSQNTEFLESSEKIDWYYGDKTNKEMIGFRLREEKNTYTITQKKKKITAQGLEINEETEFEVSSPEKFRELCAVQNIPFLYKKIKNVKKYQHKKNNSMLIEYVDLQPVGKFLEIEIVTDTSRSQDAQKKILEVFKGLQLENFIEKKPYYILMKEAGVF